MSCPLCASLQTVPWSRHDDEVPAVRCDECRLVYLTKRLAPESARAYYDGYNCVREEQNPSLAELRREMYELDRRFTRCFTRPGRPLLDYGCGNGTFAAMLDGVASASGFDVDVDAIEKARTRWPTLDFDTDLDALLERRGPFVTVTLRGTLQYVRDFQSFASDIERLVATGGRVILLATPNADSPLAEILRENWVLHNRVEHLTIFSVDTVRRLFEGFDVEHFDFPYIGTPYENRDADLHRFVALCRGDMSQPRFPFWGSMMNVVLTKTGGASAR